MEYNHFTSFVYSFLSWTSLYKDKDGEIIKDADNNAAKYIKDSLKVIGIKENELKGRNVFNIGTGREARFFASKGAKVFHVDLAKDAVDNFQKWAKEKSYEVVSVNDNINNVDIGENKFDIVFLSGIYQHIDKPANALVKFINSIKPKGVIFLGFYRSGEYKYFIIDAIRYLLELNMMKKMRDINAIINTFSETKHYQIARMADLFIPRKFNFHPKDIINDINICGGKVLNFDNDYRDYNHENFDYFSIGGDRIYISKDKNTNIKLAEIAKDLKTNEGIDQLFGINYKEDIIKENVEMIKKIKTFYKTGFVEDYHIISLCISLYQTTRPYIQEYSYYYQEAKKNGRHKTINLILSNFIKNFIK